MDKDSNKNLVVIVVRGGVAEVVKQPENVEVKVIDWDDHELKCTQCDIHWAEELDKNYKPVCQKCFDKGKQTMSKLLNMDLRLVTNFHDQKLPIYRQAIEDSKLGDYMQIRELAYDRHGDIVKFAMSLWATNIDLGNFWVNFRKIKTG